MNRLKTQLAGTGKVFSFTLRQLCKDKRGIITLVIFALVVLASAPVTALLTGRGATRVQRVLVKNESSLPLDLDALETGSYAQTRFWDAQDLTPEDYLEQPDGADYYAYICDEADTVAVTLYGGDPESEQAAALCAFLGSRVEDARRVQLGVSEQALAVLNAPVDAQTLTRAEYDEATQSADEETSAQQNFSVQILCAVLVMAVSTYASSYIVGSVVEEKSSKLVELLMVSVRPLALLAGKILASLCYVLGTFAVLGVCYGLSGALSAQVFHLEGSGGLLALMGASDLPGMGAGAVVALAVSLLLGFLTFSVLAAVCGSGCSTTEDMGAANGSIMMIIMACYLVSLVVGGVTQPVVETVVSLLPVLGVFCAPAQFLLGHIGLPVLLLSWVVQLVMLAALMVLCERVYSALLIYRGQRVKFGTILKMAKRGQA